MGSKREKKQGGFHTAFTVIATVPPYRIIQVALKWAIISPFSIKTGYGLSISCFKHSLTPNLVL